MSSPKIGAGDYNVHRNDEEFKKDRFDSTAQADVRLNREHAEITGAEITGAERDVAPKENDYAERIVDQCWAFKAKVEKIIAFLPGSRAYAEEIVIESIRRLYQHALQPDTEKIDSVQDFFIRTAYNVRKDVLSGKIKLGATGALSLDDEENRSLLNKFVDWSAKRNIEQRIEVNELRRIVKRRGTEDQQELFNMLIDDDLPMAEIALKLEITVPGVRYRVSKLNALIRSELAGEIRH